MRDGAWKGRRVFILGGGPSLRDVEPRTLRDEITLGLNMAFLYDPTATLIYDLRLAETLSNNLAWSAYRGAKLWLNSEDRNHGGLRPDGVQMIGEARMDPAYPRWPSRLADGLYRGNNAGTAGISLADVLSAETIYLLGYDMRAEAGKPPNWHTLYPHEWRASVGVLASYRADVARIKGYVRAKVVNLTPDSALDVFPKDSLENVLGRGK